LLPGYSDAVAQEKGWIATDKSLVDLRSIALIDSSLVSPDSEDFSQVIRRGWQK
jgi:hypothetical protein